MKKTDKDKLHEIAVSRYSGAYIPFLNIPDMIETLPTKFTAEHVELSNSEFTSKFTKMLETVSRQKFTLNTKHRISGEISKVSHIIQNIINAVRDNGKEEKNGYIDTITH